MFPPSDPDVLVHDLSVPAGESNIVIGKLSCHNAHEPGYPNRWRGWHTCQVAGKSDLCWKAHDTMDKATAPIREEHDRLCLGGCRICGGNWKPGIYSGRYGYRCIQCGSLRGDYEQTASIYCRNQDARQQHERRAFGADCGLFRRGD